MSTNNRIPTTVSLPPEVRETVEEEADQRSMSMSEYIRSLMFAGRKQLLRLEEDLREDEQFSLEKEVLDVVPTEKSEAMAHDEIAQIVLSSLEQDIYVILDENDRIESSAAFGGYYQE